MASQDRLREKLKAHFDLLKLQEPSYSLRKFALELNIPAGNLSQFLASKRNFSSATVMALVSELTTSPEERKNLLEELHQVELEEIENKRNAKSTSDYESSTLTAVEFLEMTDWTFFAVRTVISLSEPIFEVGWIAEKLGISAAEAERALKVLLKLDLLTYDKKGSLLRTKKHLLTPDSNKMDPDIHDLKLRIHEQHIHHALHSLRQHDSSERDITWVNIPSNPAKLDRARELIRKFQDDMISILEDDDRSEVFRLTVQLCPVGKKS